MQLRRLCCSGVLFLIGCGGDAGITAPTSTTSTSTLVRGRVLDYATRTPSVGRTVQFGAASTVTNADGSYELTVMSGAPDVTLDGRRLGGVFVHGGGYRGDLFTDDEGTCVARYGTVTDARTRRPIAGVQISLRSATTSDGWYLLHFGCGDPNGFSIGTRVLPVSHPDYVRKDLFIGRGIFRVERLDVQLEPHPK